MSSSSGNPKKRPLAFVSEGVTDLETQKAREQVEQAKFEAECKRRERKSLRDQLRANAINKQKEFNGLVKERDDFNRLNGEELEYYNKLKDSERKKERDLQAYLDRGSQDFDLRQSQLKSKEEKINGEPVTPLTKNKDLKGIIKKSRGNKKKLGLKLAKTAKDNRPPN